MGTGCTHVTQGQQCTIEQQDDAEEHEEHAECHEGDADFCEEGLGSVLRHFRLPTAEPHFARLSTTSYWSENPVYVFRVLRALAEHPIVGIFAVHDEQLDAPSTWCNLQRDAGPRDSISRDRLM